jgi:hypothetical protein
MYEVRYLYWESKSEQAQSTKHTLSDIVASISCQMACLQETKLQNVNPYTNVSLEVTG